MTITIFKDKDCKGPSQVVSTDIRDLKDRPADKPGSISLSEPIESVLMFKNDDWHEGALFVRGRKTVTAQQMMASHPDRVIRLAVRRMLPKNKLGRQMLTKLKIYRGPEHDHQAQQPKTMTL